MYFEFLHPKMLILLPIAVACVILFSRNLRTKAKSRKIGLIVLRCLVMALAVLALSGATIRKNSDVTTTIFLVDASDSMLQAQEQEEQFVRDAIAEMSPTDQAGIVVFGSDAQIEQLVSDKKVFTEIQSVVNGTATDLEQAVQTALALFPDESAKRLVLLTDGAENQGTVENQYPAFAGENIEFKVVSYDSNVTNEVYVSDVTLPETIHQGDTFQVQVEIYATDAGAATVSLYSGRTLKGQKDVALQKGYNQLVFSDTGVEGGLKSYRVTVDAEKDTVTVNNTYSAYTTVEARTRVLLVEGTSGEGTEFAKLLNACNYDYDVVTPSGVPNKIADLTQYQTVILLDVYLDDLRDGFTETLQTYVEDYAGGMIAIGGENSYALGDYKDSVLEEILPVSMELEGEKQLPKLAMAMVIDHSGSMDSQASANTSVTCLDVAKQAAIKSLDSLRAIDDVGVLAFDDSYNWAVELQSATAVDAISEKIAAIPSGGGTSIYPALFEAVDKLKDSDASLKHIILLTDGQDGFHAYGDLLEEMNDSGITLSTVAIGSDADTSIMKYLAEQGGGRYYYSDAGTSLPRIFAQEVYLSSKSYLVNETFVPTIVNSHEILGDIFDEGSPSLLGYIATTPKATSTVLLESDREDPILAVWQYGLGKTVAWTSDGTNQWTGEFANWSGYTTLWKNIIDWTISDSDLGSDTLTVTANADSIVVDYETEDYTSDTTVGAVMTDEDGNQTEISLKAVAPGEFRAEIPVDTTGVFSINVRNQNGDEIVKNVNTAAVMQYSREYRYAEVDSTLDALIAETGGRNISTPEEVFDTKLEGNTSRKDLTQMLILLAMLFFVADIVIRRLSLDWLALFANVGILLKKKAADREKQKGKASAPEQQKGKVPEKKIQEEKTEAQTAYTEKIEKKKQTPKGNKKNDRVNVIDAGALLKKKQDRDL